MFILFGFSHTHDVKSNGKERAKPSEYWKRVSGTIFASVLPYPYFAIRKANKCFLNTAKMLQTVMTRVQWTLQNENNTLEDSVLMSLLREMSLFLRQCLSVYRL